MKIAFPLLLVFNISAFSQTSLNTKPSIDTTILGKWPELSNGAISNNGKYVTYTFKEYSPLIKTTSVVQFSDGKWKKELFNVSNGVFDNKCREFIYIKNDSLYRLKLGTSQSSVIPNVQKFQLLSHKDYDWLVCQLKTGDKEVVLYDLQTGNNTTFFSVNSYLYKSGSPILILQTNSENANEKQLKCINLADGKQTIIWSGNSSNSPEVLFDASGTQVVFTTKENGKSELWYYKKGMENSLQIAKDGDPNLEELEIGTMENFSNDGSRLFFNLIRRDIYRKPTVELAKVTVWSTKDLQLQTVQDKLDFKTYYSVIDLNTRKVIVLQKDYEQIVTWRASEDYCIAQHFDTVPYDYIYNSPLSHWPPAYRNKSALYLVSLKDGSRIKLPWQHKEGTVYSEFSPNGKYIIYWEPPNLTYYCYEIATGITRDLTTQINTDLYLNSHYTDLPKEKSFLLPPAGWLKEDGGFLIYDYYDIWLVDPLGKTAPECITNGYGRNNKTVFRLGLEQYNNHKFDFGQKLIFAAFNERTKKNGHYFKLLGEKGDPSMIHMESSQYSYRFVSGQPLRNVVFPKKARDQDVYLLARESTSEFPNYYFTKDLKVFQKISNIHPEKKYNWIKSKLHMWVAPDGDTLQGVLYMPEDFDTLKKYPVIFSYYEEFSDELNSYWTPEWTTDRINIPFFVSQGYLVFTPDIHYRYPNMRQSVLNCVVSAAKYLSILSIVDSTKMGIQGHSFGGYETGHLVTGTNIFAAASSACGYYDLISDAGSILSGGRPRTSVSERHMLGSLWSTSKNYIKNSPIFYLERVKTPLLLIAGERDGQVPFAQSIEFFLGLYGLGKPAWMLSYEDGHAIVNFKNAKDYTLRLSQFFDHYLKNKAAPEWMTKGIPAKLKGIENGYELDPTGKCSKECEVCKSLNWYD